MSNPGASAQGHVTVSGDYATLDFERHLPYPPEAVWEAITDPAQLADWYMAKARIDGRMGGSVDFWSGVSQPGVHVTGTILAWDPPHLFEHEWNIERQEGFPGEERAIIRWEIKPDGGASVLRLTHKNLTRRTAQGFAPGVHVFLERLAAYLSNTPMPDWRPRVEEIRPKYPRPQ